MSNQPPPDPLGPYHPPQPYGPPPGGAPQPGPGQPAHPVSADPWSYPSGDPMAQAPQPPAYQPGYATPTQPGPYGPTSQFPAQPTDPTRYEGVPDYGPAGPGGPGGTQPGYPPPGPPHRRSNTPLIALILAVTVLLCGGAVTAGVLVVNAVTDRAKEAIEPITDPTLPALPTEVPDLPTEVPDLPTGVPTLPTDLPNLPGNSGRTIEVVYEVTGDGPVEIIYTEKLGEAPKRISNAKLPWKVKTSMKVAALVSVTAIRSGTDNGTVSCRATVDGEEVAQRTREGTFATAPCIKMVLE